MPELPEVETIKRDLERFLVGKVFSDIRLSFEGFVQYPEPSLFTAALKGKKIIKTGRRGKYLFLHLSHGFSLVVHLRMTGRLIYSKDCHVPPDKHTHGVFVFADGGKLLFHDVRKFGTMWLVDTNNLEPVGGLAALGPEPFSDSFTLSYFSNQLQKTKSKIKSLLLSQRTVAGLGNIYVDEALFRSGLNPTRLANTLNPLEIERLFRAIGTVLQEGIEFRGTTLNDYVDGSGASGSFQEHLRVYGRKDGKCQVCGSRIKRMKVAGRSSYYCPCCQEESSLQR